MSHHQANPSKTISRQLSRGLLVAAAICAGYGSAWALIMWAGSDLHRLLARMAGGVIGLVKDHQEASLMITGLVVTLVWAFIALVCALEWRRERPAARTPAAHDGE